MKRTNKPSKAVLAVEEYLSNITDTVPTIESVKDHVTNLRQLVKGGSLDTYKLQDFYTLKGLKVSKKEFLKLLKTIDRKAYFCNEIDVNTISEVSLGWDYYQNIPSLTSKGIEYSILEIRKGNFEGTEKQRERYIQHYLDVAVKFYVLLQSLTK